MKPSIHGGLLSLAVHVHFSRDRNCKLSYNTRAPDYSTANIPARYSKFPGVDSPEFLNASSRVLTETFSFSSERLQVQNKHKEEEVTLNKEALFLTYE